MTADDYIKGELCTLAWRVGKGTGVNGMLGVLFLLRNRVTAKWQDGDWLANVNDLMELAKVLTYPDPREPEFQRVLQEVDGIYDGSTVDTLTNGALYLGGVLQKYQTCAIIGNVPFYK